MAVKISTKQYYQGWGCDRNWTNLREKIKKKLKLRRQLKGRKCQILDTATGAFFYTGCTFNSRTRNISFDCHLNPLMIDAFKVVPSTKAMSYIPALAQKKQFWYFEDRLFWKLLVFLANEISEIISLPRNGSYWKWGLSWIRVLVYERKGLKIAPFVAFYFKPQYFLGQM